METRRPRALSLGLVKALKVTHGGPSHSNMGLKPESNIRLGSLNVSHDVSTNCVSASLPSGKPTYDMVKRMFLFKLIWRSFTIRRPASVHIAHEHTSAQRLKTPSVLNQKSIREMGVVNQVRELLFNFQSPLARYGTHRLGEDLPKVQRYQDTEWSRGG